MRALRKPAAMYGITRAASGKGWKVGLKRDGVALDTQFSFGLHGGEEAALLRAQAWRDEMVKKHPPPSRRKLAERLISSNKSGIAGVSCSATRRASSRAGLPRRALQPGSPPGNTSA